ncbi:MAG: STAS domain-containing protein [Armatimonadota bacterium]|nr:STAS domain-containing protein [Armatimonadota bacterium]
MESIRLDTNIREHNGLRILDVIGEIDVYTAPQFKESVNNVIASGQRHLIINMERVTYMDSSGFGTLLSATKRLRPDGGTVNLVKCNSPITRMLRITKLDTIFGTYSSEEDALAEIKEKAGG